MAAGSWYRWRWLIATGLVASGLVLFYVGTGTRVTLSVDGEQREVITFQRTVKGVLEQEGIILNPGDRVEPPLLGDVREHMNIVVYRGLAVTVRDGGWQTQLTVPSGATVRDVLDEVGLAIGPWDRIIPPPDTLIAEKTDVNIIRSTVVDRTERYEIPYRVEREPDDSLERGITRVVARGSPGIGERVWRIYQREGREVGRELVSDRIVKPPQPRVVKVGSLSSVSRGGVNFRFSRAFDAVATAYTHSGSRTATGTWPKVGTVAVDPRVIPLGTRIYVEGYGFGVAEDVGSAIKGERIDVFLETESEVRRWGRRKVRVYILE